MTREVTLEELRELSEKATPGPWMPPGFAGDVAVWTMGKGVSGGAICYVNFDNVTGDHDPAADSQFIPACVNYVRSLLEETRDAK